MRYRSLRTLTVAVGGGFLINGCGSHDNPVAPEGAISPSSQDALLEAELLYQFGAALSAVGDDDRARDVWHRSMKAFERINARQWLAGSKNG